MLLKEDKKKIIGGKKGRNKERREWKNENKKRMRGRREVTDGKAKRMKDRRKERR